MQEIHNQPVLPPTSLRFASLTCCVLAGGCILLFTQKYARAYYVTPSPLFFGTCPTRNSTIPSPKTSSFITRGPLQQVVLVFISWSFFFSFLQSLSIFRFPSNLSFYLPDHIFSTISIPIILSHYPFLLTLPKAPKITKELYNQYSSNQLVVTIYISSYPVPHKNILKIYMYIYFTSSVCFVI